MEIKYLLVVVSSILSISFAASLSQSSNDFSIKNYGQDNISTPSVKDISTSYWNNFSSSIQVGWEHVANNTYSTLETVTSRIQDGLSTLNFHTSGNLGIGRNWAVETYFNATLGGGGCGEFGCTARKVWKVVGIASGGGLLAALFFPAFVYFTLFFIGFTSYGMAWGSFAAISRAQHGNTIGSTYFAKCQSIGASGLKNMYSFLPILLLWMGCSSLLGWILWPYF